MAAPKYLKIVTKPEPKEPFSDEDVDAIFEATRFVTDRGKTGQFNSKELLVFCYVLQICRLSDLRCHEVGEGQSRGPVWVIRRTTHYTFFSRRQRSGSSFRFLPGHTGHTEHRGHAKISSPHSRKAYVPGREMCAAIKRDELGGTPDEALQESRGKFRAAIRASASASIPTHICGPITGTGYGCS